MVSVDWANRFAACGGANDIQIFGHLASQMTLESEGLQLGWFAVGCRPRPNMLTAPRNRSSHAPTSSSVPPAAESASLQDKEEVEESSICRLRRRLSSVTRGWVDMRCANASAAAREATSREATASSTASVAVQAPRHSQQWLIDSLPYEARRFHLCPATSINETISPFNLLEYLIHLKSQAGPTAFRRVGATSNH